MFIRIKSLAVFALSATLLMALPVRAQETPTADTVMATVNGTEITLGHMIALRKSLPQQYDQIPADVLYQGILDQLVQQTLLMQSDKAKLSETAKLTLENERRALIAGDVIQGVMGEPIAEDALQQAYEKQYADIGQKTEYSAAHILVETEDEAKALIEELQNGADFAGLAKEKSIGPSGAQGGDLGWFSEGMMVAPFFDAVAALKPGEISPPVQSEFGWHVIKLKDTRSMERPELGLVRSEIEAGMRKAAFDSYIEELTKAAEIDQPEFDGLDPEIINNADLLEK